MEYIQNGKRYSLSYQELRENHILMARMSDERFLDALPQAMHLACVLCWLKELPSSQVLGDEGIIHQLAHLMHIPDEPLIDLAEIRKQFNEQLALAP